MNRSALTAAAALPLLLLAALCSHAQSAVDERAIIATAAALDAAVDAKDWQRARSLFLDEITVELPGAEPATVPADELVGAWRGSLHPGKQSFHLRGGEIVTFDGADSAVLESKAYAWNRVPGIGGDDLYEVWGDYRYELDRDEAGWRIRRFAFAPRLERGNLAVLSHRAPPAADAGADGGTGNAAGGDEGAAANGGEGSGEPAGDGPSGD